MKQAIYYHAGCSVCQAAEHVARSLDPKRCDIEFVHLGTDKDRLPEAKAHGIESVPALLLEGKVHHIDFGAKLSDLEG